jgi:hypothetical protein
MILLARSSYQGRTSDWHTRSANRVRRKKTIHGLLWSIGAWQAGHLVEKSIRRDTF